MSVPGYNPNYIDTSPYRFTKIYGPFMGYYIHRQVLPQTSDTQIPITDQRYVHRPDLLAFDYYGDEDLFWVIPVRNGLQDPIFDLTYGRVLWIPDPSYVRSLV